MKDFVVYAHYIEGSDEPFYIGEGGPKRPSSKYSRNQVWKRYVAKYRYRVEIIVSGLTKSEAEDLECWAILLHKQAGMCGRTYAMGRCFGITGWLDEKALWHQRTASRIHGLWSVT